MQNHFLNAITMLLLWGMLPIATIALIGSHWASPRHQGILSTLSLSAGVAGVCFWILKG